MAASMIPPNEEQRIAAVRRYDILDTPPDGAFERITSLAARLFSVPVAIISVVDTDRIWFKSHHGLDVEQIGREPGLCASAILQDEPWIIENAFEDPRALANPLVAGEFGLRFYAGVPLRTRDGYNLGTLCVIDREPREIHPTEIAHLEDLASVVMDEFELRLSARTAIAREKQAARSAEELSRTLQESLLPSQLPGIDGFDLASRYHVAFDDRVGGDFYDVIARKQGLAAIIGDVCGKGVQAAAMTGMARWTLRSATHDAWRPAEILSRLNDVLVSSRPESERYITVAFVDLERTPRGATAAVAIGGHPKPLVIDPSGAVSEVGETAALIGWSPDVHFTDSQVLLEHGSTMVLYTDGLLAAAEAAGLTEAGLHRRLSACAGMPAAGIASELDDICANAVRDDAAFVVARVL